MMVMESIQKQLSKAIEEGLVSPEQAENLSQKEIINFLFMPSFSMAKKITDISGRGVGLDVVKSGIGDLEEMLKFLQSLEGNNIYSKTSAYTCDHPGTYGRNTRMKNMQ